MKIAIRSEEEIAVLRQANHIVTKVHLTLIPMVQPGVSTRELDAVAEEVIRGCGAVPSFKGYHGYPASICVSVDEEIVHGIPGERILEEGQIVSIDAGAQFQGYHGDAAVSVACGEVDRKRRKLMETTDRALARAIQAAKAGAYLVEIGRAVEGLCRKARYGVVENFVGHGIGREMHEPPQIPNFDTGERGPRLKAGMVLAIEPMVNLGSKGVKVLKDGWTAVTRDGKPSAHFEHSIVVREDGGEILSAPEAFWGRRA